MVAAAMMMTDVVRLSGSATVAAAVGCLGGSDALGQLPVVDDEGRFLGFVSYGLLFAGLTSGGATGRSSELGAFMESLGAMRETVIGPLVEPGLRSVGPEASMMEVAARLKDGPGPLAVVDNSGRLLGVITSAAAFKSLWEFSIKS